MITEKATRFLEYKQKLNLVSTSSFTESTIHSKTKSKHILKLDRGMGSACLINELK